MIYSPTSSSSLRESEPSSVMGQPRDVLGGSAVAPGRSRLLVGGTGAPYARSRHS